MVGGVLTFIAIAYCEEINVIAVGIKEE